MIGKHTDGAKFSMSNIFSDDEMVTIESELGEILNSKHFSNAPIVRAFLEFVVQECTSGRGEQIKSYTIATKAFGRRSDFDPTNDTIVRTTAGRVRRALEAYYLEYGTDCSVIIKLPKGRYIPSFEFRDTSPSPKSDEQPSFIHRPFHRLTLWIAASAFATVTIGLASFFEWESKPEAPPTYVVVDVRPVEYVNLDAKSLAMEVDLRLSPALSRIELAEIIPPSASLNTREHAAASNSLSFTLKTSVVGDANSELLWQLIDTESEHILWASRQQISRMSPSSIEEAVDRIAFGVLGQGGAVPLALERYHGELFSRPTCLSRGQIVEAIESDIVYPDTRECLERTVRNYPNDASAWAVLSTFYTIRSRFYSAGNREKRAILIEHAERAAEKAVELSPKAYLTKAALMSLALRQGRIEEYDVLQQQIRADYPGDIYLQIRIATRIARLGRGREALEIFDKARKEFGINLKNWTPAIAIAYFVEGDYENAHRQISRATSDLRFVLVLRAAILGKLGMTDQASVVVDKLVATNPDIKETFYPWLSNLSWGEALIHEVADGLEKAGLVMGAEYVSNPTTENG